MREDIEQTHYEHLRNEIKKVIQEKYIVVCIVHDYHCIHCLRKPNDEKTSDAKHMCAVVVKIFPEIPAIDLPTNMEDIHNPKGSHHPLIKYIYEQLFPGCQLACKPKPWRVTLIMEIIYGGWTFIRDTVVDCFSKWKLLQYGILLNLLDNYLPLVLIIYVFHLKGQYHATWWAGYSKY